MPYFVADRTVVYDSYDDEYILTENGVDKDSLAFFATQEEAEKEREKRLREAFSCEDAVWIKMAIFTNPDFEERVMVNSVFNAIYKEPIGKDDELADYGPRVDHVHYVLTHEEEAQHEVAMQHAIRFMGDHLVVVGKTKEGDK